MKKPYTLGERYKTGYVLRTKDPTDPAAFVYLALCTWAGGGMALAPTHQSRGVVRFYSERAAWEYRAQLITGNPGRGEEGPESLEVVSVEKLERESWESSPLGKVFSFFARLVSATRSR